MRMEGFPKVNIESVARADASHASGCERIVVLTDAAATCLRSLLAAETTRRGVAVVGMRLSLKKGGCAGMSYEMSYAPELRTRDIRQEEKGVVLHIDPLATMFLLGTVIDHQRTRLSSGFTFTSPKATARCGCGESVAFG